MMNQRQIEKDWNHLIKSEEKFLNRNLHIKSTGWQEKIDHLIPKKLNQTMNIAFFKAFGLIFEKGTGLIEKTYNREKREQNYKINEFAAEIKNSRKAMKEFGKQAKISKNTNLMISIFEGVGMGAFGMGLPDIPLFLAVLLKSIYEIALTYGFSYDSKEEQIFILKIIETALLHEDELLDGNVLLNNWIKEQVAFDITRIEQTRKTSNQLAKELLYLKFVQGIPVIGIVGGISDMVYQKKIADYALMKYKRRFLERKR
ncbi:MAG: EcsC family protein [Velocimicrobium sp.]